MNAEPLVEEQAAAPPFEPDPDIVGHLEGNRGSIRRFHKALPRLMAQAAQMQAEFERRSDANPA